MGDRTWCRLTVSGILEDHDVKRLAKVIENSHGGPLSDIEEAIAEGLDDLEFEDINYAALDPDLEALMRELDLSYVWEWDAGDEYTAGVHLYDARTQTSSGDLVRVGHNLVLTIEEAENPEDLAQHKAWQAFWDAPWPLTIASSHHQVMELAAAGKLPEGYFELRNERKKKAAG